MIIIDINNKCIKGDCKAKEIKQQMDILKGAFKNE